MRIEPKPCPNCKSTRIWRCTSRHSRVYKFSYECAECHWCSGKAMTKIGAVIKWNTQPKYIPKH